jgi:cytochrome P450
MGRFVPAGTIVSTNPWLLHFNKKVFGEDAGIFRPERWMEGKERAAEMWKQMFHFGGGPHICLGRNVVLMEMWKLIPVFMGTFEVYLHSHGPGMDERLMDVS